MTLETQVQELNKQLPATSTTVFNWIVKDELGNVLESVPVLYTYTGAYVVRDGIIDFQQTLIKQQLLTLPTTTTGLNLVDTMGYELPDD